MTAENDQQRKRGQGDAPAIRAFVVATAKSDSHTFSKVQCQGIELIAGIGVSGDAHSGAKVKHRSRVRANPNQPNLRQVHLIHAELHAELASSGFPVGPGEMGENITTSGIDLLRLSEGTQLQIGTAAIQVTGLRNPCIQLNGLHAGLMEAVLERDAAGNLVRKSGVMAIVLRDGEVRPGDAIEISYAPAEHVPLRPV